MVYRFRLISILSRAITQLYNLARGHVVSLGRNYITLEDIPLATKVVLSTASIERVAIMDLLLTKGGRVTLAEIAKSQSMSKSTALKTMTELAALKVVNIEGTEIEYNLTQQIMLRQEFKWLLSFEFARFREGFNPVDNSGYNNDDERGEAYEQLLLNTE